jgi:hypothetical protein
MINTAAKCSVKLFYECLYNGNLKGLAGRSKDITKEQLKEAFEAIYTEYTDLSGNSNSEELQLSKKIQQIAARVSVVELFIKMQKVSLQDIGIPCTGAFDMLKRIGHTVKWVPEEGIEAFEKKLAAIESKEKRYKVELEILLKQLGEEKSKADKNKPKNSKVEFKKMLNLLGKSGYRIDYDKTMVDDLAIMIQQHNEECQQAILNSQKTTF